MPWKTSDGTYLKEGRGWTDSNGIKHPTNWMIWTEDYKKNTMNLTWEEPLGPFDNFYYYGWNSDGDALVPKPVADLKTSLVLQAKQMSAYMLSDSDWYVVRKTETNTATPDGITAYRTAIRTNYSSLKTAINNASDIAGLQSIYEKTAGASDSSKEIDATKSSVVSTSDNTITIANHGFVDDEQVYYYVGVNSDDEEAAVIGGLKNESSYFVHSATTNTIKLSESHSNCGDAAVVSLTGLSSDGTKQTFTSRGKPGKGKTWPDSKMPKYGGA
tara:strand:- start:65 stop:880 length:816 start_codon:yes stop_codon:yes gene_type:complete